MHFQAAQVTEQVSLEFDARLPVERPPRPRQHVKQRVEPSATAPPKEICRLEA